MKRFFTTWNPAPSKITNGFEGAVGRTPLIRIKTLSEKFKCEILGKAEFLNPGGSVKDRAAYFMIREAEKSGKLRPGGTVVEGTAGNTGIGIAHICRARGYKCVIFMPNTQSKEKIDLLKMLGAEVHAVPAVPYEDPKNYNHQAKHFAESLGNAVWTNQFDNIDNRNGHFKSTGPELWYQTEGKVDAFTCATGTGGTLAGVTAYLKSKKSDVKCYLADPPGSCLYKYITSGGKSLERIGSSITEGIGQGRVTNNLAGDIALLDGALYIPDEETTEMVYRLLDEEGLFIGASSALNVVAACKVAQLLGPGKVITTVICDGAYRYQSRLFSKSWLESKKLFNAIPEHLRKYASLQ